MNAIIVLIKYFRSVFCSLCHGPLFLFIYCIFIYIYISFFLIFFLFQSRFILFFPSSSPSEFYFPTHFILLDNLSIYFAFVYPFYFSTYSISFYSYPIRSFIYSSSLIQFCLYLSSFFFFQRLPRPYILFFLPQFLFRFLLSLPIPFNYFKPLQFYITYFI